VKLVIVLSWLGVLCLTAEIGSAQTQFSATLTCGGSNAPAGEKKLWDLGPPGIQLLVTQQQCTWSNFKIAGINVTKSLMTGVGTQDASQNVSPAKGYDYGTLDDGVSHYYAVFDEKELHGGNGPPSFYGTWTVLMGDGKLTGLSGAATYNCPNTISPLGFLGPEPHAEIKCSMKGEWVLKGTSHKARPAHH
jgi:hypothetical protein